MPDETSMKQCNLLQMLRSYTRGSGVARDDALRYNDAWGDCMLRVCLIASLVLLALSVSFGVKAGSGDQVPLRITEDPGADLAPAIAVYPDGRVAISWQHYAADGSKAQLVLARSPEWSLLPVAPLSPSQAKRAHISLAAAERLQADKFQSTTIKGEIETCLVAWSQPATNTLAILRYALGQEQALALELPIDCPSDFTLDSEGHLHVAWIQGDKLNYWDESRAVTSTTTITPASTVTDLSLAIAGATVPHLAWAGRERLDQATGISYTALISAPTQVQVTSQGHSPRLLVGPGGRAHLCWLADGDLYYANSQDWASAYMVVTGSLTADAFAFAVGPGEVAHIVWVEDQALWYANSADWRCSQRPLVTQVNISKVSMVVDRSGRPHIAWSALDDKGNADIYYLCPAPKDPQLSIAYPVQGEMLTNDTLVKAESNLLSSDLLRVEFYLQLGDTGQGPSSDVLLSLGVDRDGRDGWNIPLHIADLEGNRLYRVLALGVDLHGRMIKALGDWFTVQQASTPWVWLQTPDSDMRGGEASVAALAGSAEGRLRRLDLFLAPLSCSPSQGTEADAYPLPPQSLYVGSYSPSGPSDRPVTRWQQMTYDSRRLADGRYNVVVVATDRLARRGYGLSTTPLVIDNSVFPSVEVVSPSVGAVVRDVLRASARASDLDGVVQRVDFYAEHARPLLQARYRGQDYELDVPGLVWLGSDADGSDGWAIRVPVDERLDGDAWYIRTVAFDDQGLATSVRSPGTFAIVGQNRPHMQIISPSPESTLRLTETIKLSVPVGPRYLTRVQIYAQDPAESLTYLGEMRETSGLWLYEWDTRALPDGEYALLIAGYLADGHKSLVRSGRLFLQNAQPLCSFAEPVSGQILRGSVPISLTQSSSSAPIIGVGFYYEDEGGQLRLIGRDEYKENGWGMTWDTTTALDGAYELVAWVVDAAGYTSRVGQEVTVRNGTPSISLRYFTTSLPWQGMKQIFWEAESPLRRPMSVTVEYSPDDGTHWIMLDKGIPATGAFLWNTATYPDSLRARLRLVVTDGGHYGQVTSPSFVLNNVNEPPHVTLLAPKPGKPQSGQVLFDHTLTEKQDLAGGQVYIAWQAYDPDGDALTIDLDYRRGNEDWLALARRLPNTGSYVWQTKEMPAAEDYALRITANDPAGATGSDSVEGIRLISGNPPIVRLLSPNGRVRLEKETIILWQATSEDDKELLIDLYYSDNAGQTWLPLAEELPNTGYYVWQTSYLPVGSQYRVRVVARGRSLQAMAESEEVFSIGTYLPPQVTPLSPAPGSSVSGIQCVRWSVSNPDSAPLYASLLFSLAGKANWRPLAIDMPDDGFYLWDTRSYPDGAYDLRVTISDGLSLVSTAFPQPLMISNRPNHPPQVELVSPRGGESWSGVREVSWQAWDVDGDVLTATLYLGLDGGKEWAQIATLDARAGHTLWDTSQAPPGREYQMRIVVSDSWTTTEDISQGAFHLINCQNHPPQVRFISPDPQGKLLRGSIVTWSAEDADNDPLVISLAISDDDGATWRDIASNLFNAGEYALDSSALKPGYPYRLRLRASDGMYEMQARSMPFKLAKLTEQRPELKITSPRGGEKWSNTREVRWQASDSTAQSLRIDVEFSHDGGQSWSTLASGLANTGLYQWDTRGVANGTYLLRLSADNGQTKSSEISEPFVVDNPGQNAPVVSMTCPRGGEIWSGTREITWRVLDADGDLITTTLFYSLDMGNTWHALAQSIPNTGQVLLRRTVNEKQNLSTGSYVWDTTTIPNCDRVWLRATASDGQFWSADLCDGPFVIRNPHAPLVKLLAPRGREQLDKSCPLAGKQRIVWATAQQTSRPIKVELQISLDAGQTWGLLAASLPPQGSYLWDTSTLSEDSRVIIRVTASDGLQSAIDFTDEPLIVRGNRPRLNLPFYLP